MTHPENFRAVCLFTLCFLLHFPLEAQSDSASLFSGPSVNFSHGPLQISKDGRHLIQQDGTAFFWLGDTAWELFHRLNHEESERYLEDRRSKGFTVIQAVVLADLEGLTVPNAYGHLPLLDNDPTKPNELYFKDVDFVVDQASQRGMYIGMLPTWGDKFNKKWGFGPEIFTPENARWFGEYLGKRYRDKPIVWILGGDRIPETKEHYAIIRAMADGIRKGDGGNHLITFHPWGENSSSLFFHSDVWLDFNLFQSGHIAYDMPNYKFTEADYRRTPPKPVIDGEPRYEDHPVKWDPKNGWFDDFDVRQAAYWSMLSGAAGHTYGDNNIWQMWQPDRKTLYARTPWYEALHHPGSRQMGLMRKLFESHSFLQLQPAQYVLIDNAVQDAGYQCASVARDGSSLLAYTPSGKNILIDLKGIKPASIRANWFDPRTGKYIAIPMKNGIEPTSFDPPGEIRRGNDWILVLESDQKVFTVLSK